MDKDLQSAQEFVAEKCGGKSLSHLMSAFEKHASEQHAKGIWPHYPTLHYHIDGNGLFKWIVDYEDGEEYKEDCRWIFLNPNNTSASFLDQSEKTQLAIAQLLGWSKV